MARAMVYEEMEKYWRLLPIGTRVNNSILVDQENNREDDMKNLVALSSVLIFDEKNEGMNDERTADAWHYFDQLDAREVQYVEVETRVFEKLNTLYTALLEYATKMTQQSTASPHSNNVWISKYNETSVKVKAYTRSVAGLRTQLANAQIAFEKNDWKSFVRALDAFDKRKEAIMKRL
ncbi:MAG: hypothetical protein KGO83_00375 [Paenibacillaceae bacterium]|nr:hypothetical protein [Paenibacillaceae bacterium]